MKIILIHQVGEEAGEGGDGQPQGRGAGAARPRQDHGAEGNHHLILTPKICQGCSVAQLVVRWPAVWQARVQIPPVCLQVELEKVKKARLERERERQERLELEELEQR
jgi:hypothetical protein